MRRTAVEGDFPCRRCGYNVRGLQPEGRCPECNAPVIAALHPHLIEFADPLWLKRLKAGRADVLRAGVIMLLLVAMIRLTDWDNDPYSAKSILFVVVAVLFYFLLGRAAWNLSEPSLTMSTDESFINDRKLFRSLIISVPLTFVLAEIFGLFWGLGASHRVMQLGSPIGLLGMISVWGYARYMKRLAMHIGLDFAVRRTSLYLCGYIVSWLLHMLSSLGLTPRATEFSFFFYHVPVMVSISGFSLLLAYAVPDYIGGRLKQIEKTAEANWQQATEPHADPTITPDD